MLRCMSTSSSFISDLVLPAATSHLVREPTGRFALRRQHHQDIRSSDKILARIDAQDLSLRLDTALEVVLEPPPGSCLTPASSASPHLPLLLSDGDCLHFTEHYLKILYTARPQTMPPLLSPMDESQGPPQAKEDSETDASDDDFIKPPNDTVMPEITETPTKDRAADKGADDAADLQLMAQTRAQTPKARVKYGRATYRRRINDAMSSDAAGPTSSAVATEAAVRSVAGSAVEEEHGETIDRKSPTLVGKLSSTKKGSKRKAPPRPQSAEDTYGVLVEEEPPGKKTRLPKAAREETPGEEIVVAPRSRSVPMKAPQRSSGRTKQTYGNDPPAPTTSLLNGRPPKAVFTMCTLDGKISGWFKKKVTEARDVPTRHTKYVCVTREKDLPTTAKILKTLVAGKPIVSVRWVLDSHKAGAILDPDDYTHPELQGNEGKDDRRSLFTGLTLFFTNAAVKSYGQGWDAIQEVAKEAGATAVVEGTAAKGDELTPKHSILLFGDGNDDNPARSLVNEHGRTVWDKAMFAQAIIRAELDLDSNEFKLSGGSGTKVGRKR